MHLVGVGGQGKYGAQVAQQAQQHRRALHPHRLPALLRVRALPIAE